MKKGRFKSCYGRREKCKYRGGIYLNKRWVSLVTGITMLSITLLLSSNISNASVAKVLTPDQMKSGLTDKDIKEATPIDQQKDTELNEKDIIQKDDIGMPIGTSENTKKLIEPRSIYPDVNSYILQHNFKHPNVTQELHEFSMFNYGTSDGKPSGVVVHYTDNPNNYSARSEADYEINGGWQSAFVHTFIDAGTILNIHDTDYGAWGCGPVGNKYFTQFEMVTARNFDDFAKTTSYSAWYTAYLLVKYNLTPSLAQANGGSGTVWTHHNVTQYLGGTDHTDPDAYFAKYGYDVNQFFGLVQYYYVQLETNTADLNAAIVEGNHIHVKGWHVNSKAANQQNSFLFLLDANTKAEVKRYRIQRKNRQDVKNAFPNVTSALNSGFDEEIPVTDDMYGRKLVVMSRYSGDINGNLNNTDYLFNNNVISFPDATASHLDTFKIANNKIEITGWHASTASRTAQSSYLILMDASNGQEYKRYKITRTARPDVQAAVPYIYNSLNSGFKLEIPITSDMHGKTFKVISRYASQDNGQGSLSDVNFDQTIGLNENISSINDGWMDANMLHVRGWHAIDDIANKPYHTLIFMDANTNSELSRTTVTNTQRPDVQQAYPNIANSLNSGFSADINLTAKMKGKKIYVLSRYSKTANPNQDFIDSRLSRDISTFSTNESAENVGNIDELTSNGATLKVRGWHAANATKGKQYHFLILMDRNSNQEIKRIKVTNEKRTDVRAAVPYLYNSLNSGFNTNISITNDLKGRYIYVLSRYTSDSAGNNNTVDYLGNKTLLVK
ncbi:hypothetical protein GKC31_03465 [Lactobacillus curvatus]|nr:hypothetical protein [Latilactobacillus curvatus]